jgi:hypothetical protein
MAGPKAEAATKGIREMLLRCQTTGPRGVDKSYFQFVLIRFDDQAEIVCNMEPVRHIDPESIEIRGDGGMTNIRHALELAYDGLDRYFREIVDQHPERNEHPVPLVLLFSDGHHNAGGYPEEVAQRIKGLNIDGDPVIIACAGVATDGSDQPDERLLQAIASPECYVQVRDTRLLKAFLANVASWGYSTVQEVARGMRGLLEYHGGEGDR